MKGTPQQFFVGPLSFRFEAATGLVRDICFHGQEVLRGIYPAVRDGDWATVPPQVEPPEVHTASDSVQVVLQAHVLAPGIEVEWTARIEADTKGRLRYGWRGTAKRASKTNRTGLCVLHPAEAAGTPCEIEHTDGSRERGSFPKDISPHQPFRDIRAVTYDVNGRFGISLRVTGDVFEMEDQRNWTDASFKTYCRPLTLPYPYDLPPGATVEQSVTLEVRTRSTEAVAAPAAPSNQPTLLRLPEIGFTLPGPVPSGLRARLRALNPGHVRVETTCESARETLAWAVREADFLECTLVLAVRGADGPLLPISSLPQNCALHLFDSIGNSVSTKTLEEWSRAEHRSLATGTLHNFAELNRHRPPTHGVHAATVFGINAQVHASDDESVLETLTQHRVVALAAQEIGHGRPVIVAPISLGRTPDSVDPRVREKFGAEWLLGSLKELAQSNCVPSVTYFQTHGPIGFLDERRDTPVERLLLSLVGRQAIASTFSLPE